MPTVVRRARSRRSWYDQHRHPHGRLPQWADAWGALYAGQLVADDIEDLAAGLVEAAGDATSARSGTFRLADEARSGFGDLLGNHEDLGQPLPEALDRAMKELNGDGIWRAPKSRGVGANPYEVLFTAKNEPLGRWRRRTLAILKAHLAPDPHSRTRREAWHAYRIPVLSPSDRRAFLQALWVPYLPDAGWRGSKLRRDGSAQVYLDVSGSMNAEMPLIVALLAHHPPPLLGLQRCSGARRDRQRAATDTHLRRDQHALCHRAPRAHPPGGGGRDRWLHRGARSGPPPKCCGGALSGKHLSHIDRVGAYVAREAAIRAVQSGAEECLVRVAYAPNRAEPLDINYAMRGRGRRQAPAFFSHPAMVARYPASTISAHLAQGRRFFDLG